MIRPGTLCLIVKAPYLPELVGTVCAMAGPMEPDCFGHDCIIATKRYGVLRAAYRLLVPLNDPDNAPAGATTRAKEREK